MRIKLEKGKMKQGLEEQGFKIPRLGQVQTQNLLEENAFIHLSTYHGV